MKKIGNFIFAASLLFIGAQLPVAAAAEVQTQVNASVDRDQMALGDAFTLSVAVTSNEDFDAAPKLPTLIGLEIINSWADGKSQASSMGSVNGKVFYEKKVSQVFNFMLSPNKEGKLVIPVMDVAIGNKTYKTQPLTIDVAEEHRGGGNRAGKNATKPDRRNRGQLIPGYDDEDVLTADDMLMEVLKQRENALRQFGFGGGGAGNNSGGNPFGTQPRTQEAIPQRDMDINTKEPFFIYLEADRSEVYEGQQITANWYIYVRGQIESLDRAKFPDLKGFWKEIIEEVPSLQFSPEIVNGIPYQRALLASHALFPIKAGTATIDEFKIKARTRTMTTFGMGKSNEFTKVSKRLAIKVLPLPLADKPKNFSGAVGSFQAQVRADGLQFPAHQPFSVKVRFEGSGNAKLIDLPNINWPENLEVFDTKSEAKFFKNGQSYKEFEILLIPRAEGPMVFPAFEFSHFNPELKKYVTVVTEPLNLIITAGTAGVSTQNGVTKNNSNETKTDGVFRTQPIIDIPQANLMTPGLRYGIYLFAFLASVVASAISFLRQLKNLQHEPALELIVSKKLQQIQKNLNSKNFRQVGAESVNLIYALATYLSGQKTTSQEWHKLAENMPLKLKEKFLLDLTAAFDFFQLLGFAPEAVHLQVLSGNTTEAQIEKLKKLAVDIGRELKKNDSES